MFLSLSCYVSSVSSTILDTEAIFKWGFKSNIKEACAVAGGEGVRLLLECEPPLL